MMNMMPMMMRATAMAVEDAPELLVSDAMRLLRFSWTRVAFLVFFREDSRNSNLIFSLPR
jgi:hypothetical protein